MAIDDNVAHLLAALLRKFQHELEMLPLIVLGALISAAKGLYHLITVALGIGTATLQLRFQALVCLGLLFSGDAGVDNGDFPPGSGFAFLPYLPRPGKDAQGIVKVSRSSATFCCFCAVDFCCCLFFHRLICCRHGYSFFA
ncbi:hypothetical protein FOA19_10245 [Rufibacter hautae]|uniref:Uncharacterized protein n=1 Tax=Rufibacter hautae TaxID=2595005 RepID=A0A5B6TB33_9BACT|nr:hypothetical protein [Rufibacter hautae]KAA3437677.1 hypothetical protein FOA19_10245 [Rufibacter hautae]